jgi:hypothetical protein
LRRLPLLVLALVAALAACGKGKSPDPAAPSASAAATATMTLAHPIDAGDDAGSTMDVREAAQWEAAKDGDPEELMRLADLAGCEGLHEGAVQPELRPTALLAMQYCRDFSELPFLSQVGIDGNDADARAALGSAVALAARPRRSVDPEDADELHTGCATLLSLARAVDRPRDRRVLAIRALRMLSEYGCVKRADIPADLDAH